MVKAIGFLKSLRLDKMNKQQLLGFDTDRYLKYQSAKLKAVLNTSNDKLYIEFGGKLINDKHSTRVLPGYRENTKFELLKRLCRHGEPIFVVSSRDILEGRIRGDFSISYDQEALRVIDELAKKKMRIRYVSLTLLDPRQPLSIKIKTFEENLRSRGIKTYRFFNIKDYPKSTFKIENLGINPFINIKKKLILIISPGGGSGKFGVCLSQFYHELKSGNYPRYLKFETFPVHDLPISHPVNLAYMAASADFYDVVMKDPRHGKATSYQRDLENYELLHILARKFKKYGKHLIKLTSATHMGVNMVSKGIINDQVVQKEAAAEIARRLIRYKFEVQRGKESVEVLTRVRNILKML